MKRQGGGNNLAGSPGVGSPGAGDKTKMEDGTRIRGTWNSLLGPRLVPIGNEFPGTGFQQVADVRKSVSWRDSFGSKVRTNVEGKYQNQVQHSPERH